MQIINVFINIVFILIASFTLWMLFTRKRVFSNNDFWDFIFLLLIFSTIGYYILSYEGIIISNFFATLIFFKLKTYSYKDIFDFFSIFTGILLITDFIFQGYIYLLLIILLIILIILLRVVKRGYSVILFLFVYSIIYYFDRNLWMFSNNYIYNLDLDAIVLLSSILFLFIGIFFKEGKYTYDNILKRKV